MKDNDIIWAWKNPLARDRATGDINHPAGPAEIPDDMLRQMSGGTAWSTDAGCITGYIGCNPTGPITVQNRKHGL